MDVDVAVVDEVVDVGFLVDDVDGTSVHLELVKDNDDDDGVLL